MVTNYYVLSALTREWDTLLKGSVFVDAYSHLPGELTMEFEQSDGRRAIRVSARPGDTFAYSQDDPRRPRTNVTSLFDAAFGERIATVEIAEGDRIVSLNFEQVSANGSKSGIQIHPYGPRPNVLLVSDDEIVDAFKRSEATTGGKPPSPRTPVNPKNRFEFEAAMRDEKGEPAACLRRLYPQFGTLIAREAVYRGDDGLWQGVVSVLDALRAPEPVIQHVDGDPLLSPLELLHLDSSSSERFASFDEGVRWIVKRRSREQRLESGRKPLLDALGRSVDRWTRRIDDLEAAQSSESRADSYEKWGNLLMSFPGEVEPGSETVMLPNVIDDGSPISIPLDPSRTAIQNAEKYYDKARRLREERTHLSQRLNEARENREMAASLLETLRRVESAKDFERLKKEYGEELRRFVGGKTPDIESAPFRRIKISGGYEIWVGRNARENDSLTFEHAARHDLWMHARGVPGSHVVLRVPGRQQSVDRAAKEEAAGVAAWFSRARGSGLVPVQIALRKHVTKPRGAAPGVVRVQNEEVLLVEPRLPGG